MILNISKMSKKIKSKHFIISLLVIFFILFSVIVYKNTSAQIVTPEPTPDASLITKFCTLLETLTSGVNFDERVVACAAGHHIEGNDCVSNFRPADNIVWIGNAFSGFWASSTLISNTPPVATGLTVSPQPTNMGYYIYPVVLTISVADVYDLDGNIASVDYYYSECTENPATGAFENCGDQMYLGTDIAAPFSIEWTDMYIGNYQIRARAMDNNGATVLTEPIDVRMRLNQAPNYVAINSPANGDTIGEPILNINASATDSDGTITKIEIYQKRAEETYYPLRPTCIMEADPPTESFTANCTWERVAPGTYDFKAIAMDDHAGTTDSAILLCQGGLNNNNFCYVDDNCFGSPCVKAPGSQGPVKVNVVLPEAFLRLVAREPGNTDIAHQPHFDANDDVEILAYTDPMAQRLQLSKLDLKVSPILPAAKICQGGSNSGGICDDDADCPGGSCAEIQQASPEIALRSWNEAEIINSDAIPLIYTWNEVPSGKYKFIAEGTAFWDESKKFTFTQEISTGYPEICEDGLDNDGDGVIDNGCVPINFTVTSIIPPGAADDFYLVKYKRYDVGDNADDSAYDYISSPGDINKGWIRQVHITFTHKFLPDYYRFKVISISPANPYDYTGAANILLQNIAGQSALLIAKVELHTTNNPAWLPCSYLAGNGSYDCNSISQPWCNVQATSCGGESVNTTDPGTVYIDALIGAPDDKTILITSPINKTEYTDGNPTEYTINSSAAAFNILGISKVEFVANGVVVCTDTAPPYTCVITANLPIHIIAQAYATGETAAFAWDSIAVSHSKAIPKTAVILTKPLEDAVLKRNSFKEIKAVAFTGEENNAFDKIDFVVIKSGQTKEQATCTQRMGQDGCFWQISQEAGDYTIKAILYLVGGTTPVATDTVAITITD
ncbi:MAG: hypothetical protein A2Y82_02955 [Candidatus Buchananbacteria bacterium RBG_13_36_9]|uniref:Uncharacterized protein n=1 Tax=Candidatus Buchananbacteria bacterium RBG_13_36_9 TaxID=1797530 RepID=A0A1G1XSL8_9BACT|nr:MAG: hypothetical protein A2Y82_02955 [Candidatus Buchananbacteria bacterium RBG_13_36_9]